MAETKNVYQRLLEVQRELVAPREITGKFGKSRSAEQILEAAKPVCNKHGLYLHTTDDMTDINGRNYMVATARVVNVDKPEEIVEATAYAWENEVERNKYGAAILDTSQVSGKTSSYAKKYALQNLLAIDDTKDADHFDDAPSAPAHVDQTENVKAIFGLANESPKLTELKTEIDHLLEDAGHNPVKRKAALSRITTIEKAEEAIKSMKGGE